MKLPFKEIAGIRVLASGVTGLPCGATIVLDTKLLNTDEVVFSATTLLSKAKDASWAEGNFMPSAIDHVNVFFRKTAVSNEIQLVARNNDLLNHRTLQWAIITIQL